MRTGRLAGHYFMMLGTAVVLGMIVGPILKDSPRIDFTFILYFWIGVGLLNARQGRRKLALVLCTLGVLFCSGYLTYVLLAAGPVVGARSALRTPLLAAIHGGIMLFLLLPPLILLLLPRTRRWFAEHREAPPSSYSITGRMIALYVLAACVPIAAGIALDRSTRTATPSGETTSFRYGDGKLGTAAVGWMVDEDTRQVLYVSWLVFAEADSFSYSSARDGHMTFGRHRISVPDGKTVQYLSAPPMDDEKEGNVLLVREDGTVIRLARRVTSDRLDAARDAARGARNLDDLRERLESLLPSY